MSTVPSKLVYRAVEVSVSLDAILVSVRHNSRNTVCGVLAEACLGLQICVFALFDNKTFLILLIDNAEILKVHIDGSFACTDNIEGHCYEILLSAEVVTAEI